MKRLATATITWGQWRTALVAWILTQVLGPASPGLAKPGLLDGPRDDVGAPTTTGPVVAQRASDIDAAFLSDGANFSARPDAAAQILLRTTEKCRRRALCATRAKHARAPGKFTARGEHPRAYCDPRGHPPSPDLSALGRQDAAQIDGQYLQIAGAAALQQSLYVYENELCRGR